MTGELLYGPDGEGEILSVIRQKLLIRVISHGNAILFTHWGSVFTRHALTLSGSNDRPTQRILFVKTEEVSRQPRKKVARKRGGG